MDKLLRDNLRQRYKTMHPLMFLRSVEHAETPGDAFDILETMPDKYPIIWMEEQHRWIGTDNLLQSPFGEQK